jgi:hypothetical protein
MKNSFRFLITGFLLATPALAQGTAGNTPNTGPEGSGNFVAGKPEGEGTGYVSGRPRERDASYMRPEGEGTSYVGGKPANERNKASRWNRGMQTARSRSSYPAMSLELGEMSRV